MPEKKTCINCGAELLGPHCHQCGQKTDVKRISLKSFILDFTDKWLGWDNKFLRTFQGLSINPGSVPREYIRGNRARYVGPLGYAFLTTAIMLIVYNLLGINVQEMVGSSQDMFRGSTEPTPQDLKLQEINKEMLSKISEYFRFMIVTMIPFMAISGIMFYRNKRNRVNYLEQCVLFFYLAGHTIWFNVLSAPLLAYYGLEHFWMIAIFSYLYTLWGIISFHREFDFEGIVRATFSYIVGFLFFMVGIFIFAAVYLIFFSDFVDFVKENAANGAGG